jgi:hypothetical protein
MSYQPLQRRRPPAVLVLAILHLVGGGFDLLGAVCGGIGMAMQNSGAFTARGPGAAGGPDMAEMQRKMNALPGYQAVQLGELGATLVLGVMLLAAGIGLLNMQPWARTLSLTYAPLAIATRLGSFVYALLVVIPGLEEIFRGMAAQARPGAGADEMMGFVKMGGTVGAVVQLLFIAYPIVVLVVLTRAHVVAAFRGEEPSRRMDLPDDDEGWGAMKPRLGSTDVTDRPEG